MRFEIEWRVFIIPLQGLLDGFDIGLMFQFQLFQLKFKVPLNLHFSIFLYITIYILIRYKSVRKRSIGSKNTGTTGTTGTLTIGKTSYFLVNLPFREEIKWKIRQPTIRQLKFKVPCYPYFSIYIISNCLYINKI